MYIHKIITLLSLHLVPKISLTCFNVKIIILSDSYGTVTLPRHWMESNSKRPNWVSEQIHPELRILIFLFHTVTDMDCDQKWITHESQCKFIVKGFWRSLYSTIKTMRNSFQSSWMWPGCTIVFHARMALKSAWSSFKERESAFSTKDTATVNQFTLTICTFTQNTANYAQRSHDSILKEVHPPSTQFFHIHPWHCWAYSACIFYTHLPSQ